MDDPFLPMRMRAMQRMATASRAAARLSKMARTMPSSVPLVRSSSSMSTGVVSSFLSMKEPTVYVTSAA